MGKIIRNGIKFSGTVDTANNINYDNSLSGLEAKTAQEAIDEINDTVDELNTSLEEIKTSFQDGCDTIVAGCTTYGATPTSNSPTDIVNAVKTIHTDRYNAGVTAGKQAVNPVYITHGVSIHTAEASATISNYDKVLVVCWGFNDNYPTITVTKPSGSTTEYDSSDLRAQIATATTWRGATRAMIVSGVKGKAIKFSIGYGGMYIIFGLS